MKKIFALLLIIGTSLYGCHKPGTNMVPYTNKLPSSTFNISYNGKAYHISYQQNITSTSIYSKIDTLNAIPPVWKTTILIQSANIRCSFSGLSTVARVGVYKAGNAVGGSGSILELLDYDDASKFYTSAMDGNDTASTITVTEASDTLVKGTFNIILTNNSHYYPATGDFAYQR